ncbi:MAG: RNA methyltransferase [Sporomusaceae bacterium]|nr:RNA methyltransferase [Sporomusaceae bacterium]
MTEIITSPHNKFIKLAASLKQKKYRDELGLFIVEGVRLVEEAAQSDWRVETCIYTTAALEQGRVQAIIADLESKNCRIIQVTASIYDKITDTKEPQGILAIVEKCTYQLDELPTREEKPFLVVLDELQDPGNVGTIIRTAAAAGCTGVILTKGCADVFAAKAVRSSMGSIFQVPIFEGLNTSEVISYVEQHEIDLLATSLESSNVYFKVDLSKAVAVVFGNEGNGVSRALLAYAKDRLYIPLFGHVESLNVAASAAVILYEVVRQRQ